MVLTEVLFGHEADMVMLMSLTSVVSRVLPLRGVRANNIKKCLYYLSSCLRSPSDLTANQALKTELGFTEVAH